MTALTGLLTEKLEPGSAAWLDTISASQIAAIIGASKWATPYSLWHYKKRLIADQENASMATGTHWEPLIRGWFRENNPDLPVTGEQSFRHPTLSWATANPDGVIGLSETLEIKTARYPTEWGQPGTGDIAAHYVPQVQWQLFVTGAESARVLLASPWDIFDRSYREYRVERDDRAIAQLVDAAHDFLTYLEMNVPPDPDWTAPVDRDVLRLTSRPRTDDSVELDDETALLWLETRTAAQQAAEKADAAKAAVLAASGTARRLVWRGHEVGAFRNAKNGPALYPAKNLDDLIPLLVKGTEAA